MAKLTLNAVASLTNETTALLTINNNSTNVVNAFENTLSRDGASPNQMLSAIDMNSNRILNLPSPLSAGEPLRLQDLINFSSGTSVFNRIILTADTTFWVRSDGNDANTGLVNTAAGAKRTWNGLYLAFTSLYDAGGKIVTLKSGTTGTYPAGLFMSTAWVGGGQLIIDLNGSSIAETVTKGIINDVVQPGQITIQNSAGLGVGGVISSAGFAAIQNDQPSDMNIGIGITTGPAFDAHYEATQGAGIYLSAPINVTSNGTLTAQEFVLTAGGGIFGFNGQTVNFLTNQTFTLGTIVAQSNSSIAANAVTWNLNAHTISGPRYNVSLGGNIYTAGAGATYIPGSAAGIQTSGGLYDGTMGATVIYGGAAANSVLTLSSTNSLAPSGDNLNLNASNIFLSASAGATNINLGNSGANSVLLNFTGSTSGFTTLKSSAVASGVLTLPAGTDTLTTNNLTATLASKTISATVNAIQIPYFAAELSANQGTTTTTVNKILCNTEIADPNSWYDNATNYRFTPQLAGKYKITAAVGVSGTTVTEIDLFIRVNGATKAQSFILGMNTATAQSATISKVVTLNGSTDFVEMFAAAFGTGTLNFLAAPSTWFEAQYMGA